MKKIWQERAQELLDEQKAEWRLRPAERARRWLQWENWPTLLRHTEYYASEQTRRRFWRGSVGGVLPEGQDANGVAAEAVADLLAGKCQLAVGWTRQRLEKELRRLASREIRRLQSLKEAAGMRSEWEMLPLDEEGEPRSILEEMPGAILDGAEALLAKEEEEAMAAVIGEIAGALSGGVVVKGIFGCLCGGVVKRREIARRLGVGVGAVSAGRKRLERRLKEIENERLGRVRLFIEELKRL